MNRRDWLVAIALFVGVAVLFAPDAATGAGVYWHHDLRHHHYPWRVWGAAQWLQGVIPWWSSGTANGYPLLAEGETGFLYPPGMLLFALLPGPDALNWSVLAHQVWAALGLTAFLRARGLRQLPALFGGAVWAWSGFLVSHTLYLGMLHGLSWMGWALYGAATARWAWVALSVGMMGLAGHPQAAAFGGLLLAVHAAATLRGRALLWWGGAVALGGLVASPQLLASIELSRFSMREGGVGDLFANIGGLPPLEVFNVVLPELFGFDRPADVAQTYYHRGTSYWGSGENYWEMCFYLGIPVVVLALLGARRNPGWAALAGVALLLMVGGPLWALVRLLPGYGYFRFPVRFAIWLTLALAVLAAEGLSTLRVLPRPHVPRRWMLAAAWLLGLGLVGGGMLLRLGEEPIRAALTARYEAKLEMAPPPFKLPPLAEAVLPPPEVVPEAAIPAKVGQIWAEAWETTSVLSDRVWLPVLLLVACAVALRHPRLLALLAMAELWRFGHDFHPRVPRAEVEAAPPWLAPAMTEAGGPRTTILDRRVDPALDTVLGTASMGLLWGTSDVIIPGPLLMLRNDALLALAGLDVGDTGPQKVDRYLARQELARRMSIRWIGSTHVIPGLRPLHTGHTAGGTAWTLYEDPGALPRVRVVPCVRMAADVNDAFAAVQAEDPLRTVVIEQEPGVSFAEGCAAGGGTATIRSYTDQHVEIEATGPGTLVLGDSWYPGWTATLDGARAPVGHADVIHRAVALPAGTHTVAWSYDPGLPARLLPVAALGLLVSVVGLFLRPGRSGSGAAG